MSVIAADDARLLARAAYHLGNRHVDVQITADSLRYLHDHVLDDMLRGLGLRVRYETLPFEPEAGAYSSGRFHLAGAMPIRTRTRTRTAIRMPTTHD